MAVKPITPDDVLSRRVAMIPDFVIEAVNDLLVKARGDDQIMLKQDVIVEAIIAKMRQVNTDALYSECRETIFDNHWLDFEALYSAAGWTVVYDKPAYNETGSAVFTFTRS